MGDDEPLMTGFGRPRTDSSLMNAWFLADCPRGAGDGDPKVEYPPARSDNEAGCSGVSAFAFGHARLTGGGLMRAPGRWRVMVGDAAPPPDGAGDGRADVGDGRVLTLCAGTIGGALRLRARIEGASLGLSLAPSDSDST